jgi:transcriptional regulator with XRE-family HTH domain
MEIFMDKREFPHLLAARLDTRMKEKKIDLLSLSDKAGSTYEHVRKIVRGASYPSKFFLKVLCDVLDMDFAETDMLLQVDKLRQRYGFIPKELTEGFNQKRKVS